MTEKRFTIKPQDDLFGVVDNYSADKVCVVNGIRTEIEAKWLCNVLNDLNDENEQLKSTINTLTCDNTKMKKVLNTTKKENEHIKQVIKEAYNNERTHIGKSVIQQLLEQL